MLKGLLWFVLIAGIVLGGLSLALGLSPLALWANVTVGTAMGAKLGCSGRYLTGLDADQVQADLASYSAALGAVNVAYDDQAQRATATLFGLAPTSASYRQGMGCTLDIGDTSKLDAIRVPLVARSPAPWPEGTGAPDLDDGLSQVLAQIMARDNAAGEQTRALLVIRDGRLVAERYADGFDADTPHLGWSMGKSLISIWLGNLAQSDKVAMDERALFPAWRNDERAQIRVDALLQMSSGLDFSEVYAPGSDATRMLFLSRSAADVPLASPLAYEPGTHFSYSSGTTNLLGRLALQRVGGLQAAYDWLHAQMFAPLAMARTVLEPDPSGELVGSSYVFASARDWARLGQLLLAGGVLNGHRVLQQNWADHAIAPNESANDPRYGYQLWLNSGGDELRWPDLPASAYAMQGNRAQVVMMLPADRLVLVRLGWSPGRYPVNDNFAELVAAARPRPAS